MKDTDEGNETSSFGIRDAERESKPSSWQATVLPAEEFDAFARALDSEGRRENPLAARKTMWDER